MSSNVGSHISQSDSSTTSIVPCASNKLIPSQPSIIPPSLSLVTPPTKTQPLHDKATKYLSSITPLTLKEPLDVHTTKSLSHPTLYPNKPSKLYLAQEDQSGGENLEKIHAVSSVETNVELSKYLSCFTGSEPSLETHRELMSQTVNGTPNQQPVRTHSMTTRSRNNIFKPKKMFTTLKYPLLPEIEPMIATIAIKDKN